MANFNKRAFYVNGELLRKVIELRGLTQADVYKAINIGENTIYRVIKYNRMENYGDFLKMCKFLDINSDVLGFREYNIFDEDLKHSYVVTHDNIERFIDRLGYVNDEDKKFSKEYIHDFFKGAHSSEKLSPEIEAFLFERILECRDQFVMMYSMNHIKNELDNDFDLGIPFDDDNFYDYFNSWFDKHMRFVKLK